MLPFPPHAAATRTARLSAPERALPRLRRVGGADPVRHARIRSPASGRPLEAPRGTGPCAGLGGRRAPRDRDPVRARGLDEGACARPSPFRARSPRLRHRHRRARGRARVDADSGRRHRRRSTGPHALGEPGRRLCVRDTGPHRNPRPVPLARSARARDGLRREDRARVAAGESDYGGRGGGSRHRQQQAPAGPRQTLVPRTPRRTRWRGTADEPRRVRCRPHPVPRVRPGGPGVHSRRATAASSGPGCPRADSGRHAATPPAAFRRHEEGPGHLRRALSRRSRRTARTAHESPARTRSRHRHAARGSSVRARIGTRARARGSGTRSSGSGSPTEGTGVRGHRGACRQVDGDPRRAPSPAVRIRPARSDRRDVRHGTGAGRGAARRRGDDRRRHRCGVGHRKPAAGAEGAGAPRSIQQG